MSHTISCDHGVALSSEFVWFREPVTNEDSDVTAVTVMPSDSESEELTSDEECDSEGGSDFEAADPFIDIRYDLYCAIFPAIHIHAVPLK